MLLRSKFEHQSSCCVLHSLQWCGRRLRQAGQCWVAIVNAGHDQREDESDRYFTADSSEATVTTAIQYYSLPKIADVLWYQSSICLSICLSVCLCVLAAYPKNYLRTWTKLCRSIVWNWSKSGYRINFATFPSLTGTRCSLLGYLANMLFSYRSQD